MNFLCVFFSLCHLQQCGGQLFGESADSCYKFRCGCYFYLVSSKWRNEISNCICQWLKTSFYFLFQLWENQCKEKHKETNIDKFTVRFQAISLLSNYPWIYWIVRPLQRLPPPPHKKIVNQSMYHQIVLELPYNIGNNTWTHI